MEFPLLRVPGLLPVLSLLSHTRCTQPGFEAGRCDTRPSYQVAAPVSFLPSMSCPVQDRPGPGPSYTGALIVPVAGTHPSSPAEAGVRPEVSWGFLTPSVRATPPSVPPPHIPGPLAAWIHLLIVSILSPVLIPAVQSVPILCLQCLQFVPTTDGKLLEGRAEPFT